MPKEYKKVEDIPLHIFSNKECTRSTSKDLIAYLRFMYDNHPYDLEYLWRNTQEYKDHGGCYAITFENWLTKLGKDLTAQEKGNGK